MAHISVRLCLFYRCFTQWLYIRVSVYIAWKKHTINNITSGVFFYIYIIHSAFRYLYQRICQDMREIYVEFLEYLHSL